MPEHCPFCRIARGEEKSKKVFENDAVFAFEDVAPKAPTHILVIPKRHVKDLSDGASDPALLGSVFAAAAKIARDRGLTDYRTVVNTGRGSGQSVFHLHVHLLAGRLFSWPPG